MSSEESSPIIYYSLIAFNTKIICEVNEYNDNTTISSKKEKKYIRASKKILKKIEQYEIRRPDGMGTLISGTYSYNYIHGYEYCNNTNYPLLESLIFLCVLPLYQSNPNVTSSEREIAFNFLSSIRRDFLTSFAENLQYIYNHQFIENISVQINANNKHNNHDNNTQLCSEDQNICTNLYQLSHVMIQRMHGNYQQTFEISTQDQNNTEGEQEEQQQQQQQEEEEREYINVTTTTSTTTSNSHISMENIVHNNIDHDHDNNNNIDNGPGYGSISHTLDIEDNNPSQQSRISAFVNSIVDVKNKMTSLSVSSLKSLGTANTAMSDDKFVDYETMPLIASHTSLIGGEYRSNYTRTANGFIVTHKKEIGITIAVLIVIYFVIAMFCGFGFTQCSSR